MATKAKAISGAQVLWVERARSHVHAKVAEILDGRASRDGPPFEALEAVLDELVEAVGGVKR